jgi:ABC-type sugar transport system ATPase subunit
VTEAADVIFTVVSDDAAMEEIFFGDDSLLQGAEGKTFIMITHKLDEVFAVADRVTILRDGETVAASVPVGEVSQRDVVRHMVGRKVEDIFPERHAEPAEELLRVEGLSTRKLSGVSFALRRGEVLGIGGLMGAGRTSLFDALFGAIPQREGTIRVHGEPVEIRSPRDAIAAGLAYVTEDRAKSGLALDLGVKDNVALIKARDHTRLGFVDDAALERLSARYTDKLAIDARTARTAEHLSGGNQQKVVLAKWLATEADVFLMDEPTRGIDVGTKMDVYALINELTDAGKGVLLVTSELPELMAMSDRFLVLSEGHLVRELSKGEATPEEIVYHASQKPEATAQQTSAA